MAASLLLLPLLAIGLAGRPAAAQSRVQVAVYYESLCPYCQQFISGAFRQAWRRVPEIMDVTFVPWGNARATHTSSGWQIQCQHGEQECYLNVVHACALKVTASQAVGVNFVVCMESGDENTVECARKTGVNAVALDDCVADPDTTDLMLHYRDMTDAVRPPIEGVPTVTVDGSQDPQDEIINDLLAVVCRQYQGPTPAGCP